MFVKQYVVKAEHIDVQGIMDGLYYPFYMEDCRHDFVNNVLQFDINENAKNGINIVLSEYTIKFVRSFKADDTFEVTCAVDKELSTAMKLVVRQQMKIGERKYAEGIFTATCVKATGGRPFLPEALIQAAAACKEE